MLVLKLLPLLLATVLPTVRAQPAKCEKKEFAETQAKYQQCAAAKIASISKALEVRKVFMKFNQCTVAKMINNKFRKKKFL